MKLAWYLEHWLLLITLFPIFLFLSSSFLVSPYAAGSDLTMSHLCIKSSVDLYCLQLFSRSVLSYSFVTPWTVVHQAPLSMGFLKQQYWSGLPFLFPGSFLDPGIEPTNPHLLHWPEDSLPLTYTGSSYCLWSQVQNIYVAIYPISWSGCCLSL